MQWRELLRWFRARQRILIYSLGAVIVTIWTLLRFFTARTIFDLVSQQVTVHQWLHDGMSPAHMGQTAYVLKMLLLYVPLDVLPGSPRLKLILITLVINIATFIFIGLVLERTLREFGMRVGGTFYAALLWLSTIAGSVFWIEFANSRNLEVVGGLLWIYLGLRFLHSATWLRALALTTLGGVLFFGDPLQLYMSAAPLLVYVCVLSVIKHQRRVRVAQLFGIAVVGYLIAQLLFSAAEHWLHISFHDTGSVSTPQVSAGWIVQSLQGTAKALLSLVAGAADAGRLRELANLGFIVVGAGLAAYVFGRGRAPKRLVVLVVSIVLVDAAVYIASGQAVQGAATNRYLIMIVPAMVLALACVQPPRSLRIYAAVGIVTVIGINVLALGGALQRHWNTSFPQDAHIVSAYRYTVAHPGLQPYASSDTAMALLYLYHLPAEHELPLGCLNGKLVRTHFSMDNAFARASQHDTAALMFDGDTITNTPNTCTLDSVTAQLGPPQKTDHTSDGSVVLVYTGSQLRLPN